MILSRQASDSQECATRGIPGSCPTDSGHYNSRMKTGNWETLSTEQNFANAHLEVVTVQARTPSRSQPRSWTIVHRKAAVVVAPMTRDGKIFLIRQERIPIG